MIDFFFYGTLVDAEIRRLVLGRSVPDEAVREAWLPGYRRFPVAGQPYPAAVPVDGAITDGVVMSGASLRDAAILSCFEGADYDASPCQVRFEADEASAKANGSENAAWVFVASDRVKRDAGQWQIEAWKTAHKSAFLAIADRWLDSISQTDIESQERRWRDRLGAL